LESLGLTSQLSGPAASNRYDFQSTALQKQAQIASIANFLSNNFFWRVLI